MKTEKLPARSNISEHSEHLCDKTTAEKLMIWYCQCDYTDCTL